MSVVDTPPGLITGRFFVAIARGTLTGPKSVDISTMKGILTVIVLLSFFLGTSVFAQNSSEDVGSETIRYDQAWLEYEAAEGAYRTNDFSTALRRYARALELKPRFPEAFVGMARIYRKQSDIVLAERYYRQALDSINQLEIPDQEYAIRLELATMYAEVGIGSADERKYRNELLTIIADDPVFSRDEPVDRRERMYETLLESGLNRVIVLYRLDFPQSLEAHRRYGRYLLEQSSNTQQELAVEHLLFAVVEIAGRAVDAIIDREFDYQFTTLLDLYERATQYKPVLQFLRDEDLVGTMRMLARALDGLENNNGTSAAQDIQAEISKIESIRIP